MTTFGDLIFWGCVALALWYVPRYLWKVYGGADAVKRLWLVTSSPRVPYVADEPDQSTDRPSVSADDLYLPRLQLDRSKVAIIEVMVYNGWATGEIRAVLKGDNGAIGIEVEAARQRLGVEAPDNRTPIAHRPTAAQFASDKRV